MRVTLEQEHDRILALSARLRAAICTSAQPNPVFAGVMRGEFVRMLMQHMNFKEAMIYAPLRRATGAGRLRMIEQMQALGTALHADYGRHRMLWPQARIEAEWDGYKAAVTELLDRVETAVQLERHHIYPMLSIILDGREPARLARTG